MKQGIYFSKFAAHTHVVTGRLQPALEVFRSVSQVAYLGPHWGPGQQQEGRGRTARGAGRREPAWGLTQGWVTEPPAVLSAERPDRWGTDTQGLSCALFLSLAFSLCTECATENPLKTPTDELEYLMRGKGIHVVSLAANHITATNIRWFTFC